MFGILQKNVQAPFDLTETFQRITKIYGMEDISEERKEYLSKTIEKYGYVPYPYYKVLDELSDGEIMYSLIKILEKEGCIKNSKLLNFSNPSPLSRRKIKNQEWFKKETHNIKLISLSALGNDTGADNSASFISWVAQLISLPKGNKSLNVLADTIYLVPFFEREFGCAYLPASSAVSKNLQDEKLLKFFGLDAKAQVKLFISLAQLAGHPVIYDILPQTARFSKIILSNPYAARWINIKDIIEEYKKLVHKAASSLPDAEEKESVIEKYIQDFDGANNFYSEEEAPIKEKLELEMVQLKKACMDKMTTKTYQEGIAKKAAALIEKTNGKKPVKEEDIRNREEVLNALIKEGFWTLPGGAWCSSSVPVFEKMNETKEYPLFKHYNYKGEDVTKFANLDCQTPYYFTFFDSGKLNEKVVNFYIQYIQNLQKEYNFDGFRVDHIDHIVDDLSEQNGIPVSYRIPRKVLSKLNSALKKNVPYFATLAEYMLWDGYYLEYHKDMGFDLLWGNDIVSQSSKTPEQIIKDNKTLEEYNIKNGKGNLLSILKTYNNQDGEFKDIDRYPAQLGYDGALFKWFKFKFAPGGMYANRPALYVDGDESFTQKGIERVIGAEVSMIRNKDWNFYEKFNAINYFAQHSKILVYGKAKLLEQNENGLCYWEVNSLFGSLLVIANYKNPKEKIEMSNNEGYTWIEEQEGHPIYNSEVNFKGRKLKSYFDFSYDELQKCVFKESPLDNFIENKIVIGSLNPAEFKVFGFAD